MAGVDALVGGGGRFELAGAALGSRRAGIVLRLEDGGVTTLSVAVFFRENTWTSAFWIISSVETPFLDARASTRFQRSSRH